MGGPLLFGLVRLACGIYALYSTAVRPVGLSARGQTFTYWNWPSLGVYFITVGLMSLWASVRGSKTQADTPANGVHKFLWVWFQIMSVCALFISVMCWVVLIPHDMLMIGWEDPADTLQKMGVRSNYFNWITFSAHNVNVLFCLLEGYLNRLTFLRAHASFIIIWAASYTMAAWFIYWRTARFTYVFLDWNVLGYFTPVAYVGLGGALYATFLWIAGQSWRCKVGMADGLLPTKPPKWVGTPEDAVS